ncbi:MAG: phosphoribosyltransferase family protein [bacterium]
MVNFLAERLNIAIHINQPIISQREKIIISYVPSHRWRRIFIKGYNQSQLLAQALAQQIQRPCLSLVTKNKHTRSQAKLNRAQRQKNLQNVFTLCKTLALKGDETILIADDVATTGATLNTIAKTIKSQYPKIKVWGIVLCRHTG